MQISGVGGASLRSEVRPLSLVNQHMTPVDDARKLNSSDGVVSSDRRNETYFGGFVVLSSCSQWSGPSTQVAGSVPIHGVARPGLVVECGVP